MAHKEQQVQAVVAFRLIIKGVGFIKKSCRPWV
jgi:hypothetical protein